MAKLLHRIAKHLFTIHRTIYLHTCMQTDSIVDAYTITYEMTKRNVRLKIAPPVGHLIVQKF